MNKKPTPKPRNPLPRQNETLTKRNLALALVRKFPEFKQDKMLLILHAMLDRLFEALASGQHIEFRNFGVFEVQTHKERIGRNPRQPEDTVVIPTRQVIKFKPSKKLKAALNKKSPQG